MSALLGAAALHNLRQQPMWKLLAAHRAPVIVALLDSLFARGPLSSSILFERLDQELTRLADTSQSDLDQTPQAAVAEWIREGWVTRHLPAAGTEEVYEPSVAALAGIRFITSSLKPRTVATESRLQLVIHQFVRLAQETDPDPEARLSSLRLERNRLDRAIADIETDGVEPLPPARALERLTEELAGDFRVVSAEFDRLNRGLRTKLVENDGSRGVVLEALFAGVDLIADSDAGRTFNAFWRLLMDAEQNAALNDAVDALPQRAFAAALTPDERRFLRGITDTLLNEGAAVHNVMQSFANSLKHFVQSREYLEQRRMRGLLSDATSAALTAKEVLRPRGFYFELQMSNCTINSVARAVLYDPSLSAAPKAMELAAPTLEDIAAAGLLLQNAGIDVDALRRNVCTLLETRSQVSVGDVLQQYPAEHGLGTVFGYLDLATKHGVATPDHEHLQWRTTDDEPRRARVTTYYFTRERRHELFR
ncbi:DUF3375 domain-containing protein [Rhizobacter fulvus]